MTTDDTARSFSGHRFEEALTRVADDAVWHLVGQGRVEGREAIAEACRSTAAELDGVETTWLRLVSTGPGDVVAVDAISRYAGPGDAVSTVSSCDVYEFDGETVVRITSYAVELAADDPAAAG
jgi:ketosteroid isomerase-like protein